LFKHKIVRNWSDKFAALPLDSTSTFIRSAFNGQGGFGGGGGGLRSAQLTSSITGLLAAYKDGRINSYFDVLNFSR